MNHTRTWTDVYGSACASFEGRAGGHTWLVAAPPELARAVPGALSALDGKGAVYLLVHEGLTPLLAAVRDLKARGVLIVAPEALASGPAVQVGARVVAGAQGVDYAEGGDFPEWTGTLGGGGSGPCPAASAVASLGLPVAVTSPDTVQAALEAWMDATPHGR